MSLVGRFLEAVGQDQVASSRRASGPKGFQSVTYTVGDYGKAKVRITVGDMDGSGEAPGVQLEIEHYLAGPSNPVAVALSGREAEDVAHLLHRAANSISPSDRLRPYRARLAAQRKRRP